MDHKSNSFDFIRLIGANAVVIGHAFGSFLGWDPITRVTHHESTGGFGVALFFIVSGYLITQSRVRSKNLARFFLNRILRIIPALTVMIVSVSVVNYFISGDTAKDYFFRTQFFGFLGNILVFPNNACAVDFKTTYVYGCNMTGQLYTLTVEVILYILVGLFLWRSHSLN